ncbi:MAG: coenzyme A pyrophosphatase [Flavobacteriaceae bacterium]|nr:MAG: coenzyme A pyrophosphatase [Flavobacteriaceae bacterium]
MNFTQFQQYIPALKKATLGGLKAQFKLAPEIRKRYSDDMIHANNPRASAVLALFYPDTKNETRFLLTLRASYNGTHSAQISFPGGKKEKNDTDLEQTALRETFEEVGVDSNRIKIIKQLTDAYIPPSNFLVTPYIGVQNKTPTFTPNNEVDTIIEVKLADLLDDKNVVIRKMNTSYMQNADVPCFKLNDYIVWGATAMILSEIKQLFESK